MLKGTKINLNICFKNKLYHGSNSESKNASSEIIQKCPIQCDQAEKKKCMPNRYYKQKNPPNFQTPKFSKP